MKHEKPLIAIPCRNTANRIPEFPKVSSVWSPFIEVVTRCGGYPFLIPVTDDLDHVRVLYDLADGILLTGASDDVSPALYGESLRVDYAHETMWSVNPKLDVMEQALSQWAFTEKKPLLGICRGMQILNVALGGTLYQDLPTQKGVSHDYFVKGEPETLSMLVHDIEITPGSLLATLLGATQVQVNSMHHQAVKQVGSGLRAIACSPEGTVEAIEAEENHPFCLGIQCHPEILCQETDERWSACFEAFVSAAHHWCQGVRVSHSDEPVRRFRAA